MAEPCQTITAILPGFMLSCLLLGLVLQDALSKVMNVFPPLKWKVSWTISQLPFQGEQGVGKYCGECAKSIRLVVEEKGLRKRGKNKMIASCSCLEEKFQECSKTEGVGLATSLETLEVDLRTRTKQLGATEKARRKTCDVRFGVTKLLWMGSCGKCGAGRGHCAHRERD